MKTILLIEDNNAIRENLLEILELSNYRVLTAADGEAGVAAAIQHRPDIVVCDIMMPVLDGYGVLNALRGRDELKHIPFIFLTAKSEPSERRLGIDMGAYDYLVKPIGGPELLTSIEACFSNS